MIILALLTFVASVLRLIFMDLPMRNDESYTFLCYLITPLHIPLFDYNTPNNHILFSLLTNILCTIFGENVFVIRFPSFIAGFLLIPVSYCLARILYNKRVALLSAAFIAGSTYLIDFSANARGYNFVILAIVVLMLIAVLLLEKPYSKKLWLSFIVTTAIGFFSIPVMLFPCACIGFWLLFSFTLKCKQESDYKAYFKFLRYLAVSAVLSVIQVLYCYAPVIVNDDGDGFSSRFAYFDNDIIYAEFLEALLFQLTRFQGFLMVDYPKILGIGMIALLFFSIVAHRFVENKKYFLNPMLVILLVINVYLTKDKLVPPVRIFSVFVPFVYIAISAAFISILNWVFRYFSKMDNIYLMRIIFTVLLVLHYADVSMTDSLLNRQKKEYFPEAEKIIAKIKTEYANESITSFSPARAAVFFYLFNKGIPVEDCIT